VQKPKGKTVYVSVDVWSKLTRLRAEFRAKNMSEVLEKILSEWEQAKQK